ncbi:MAG TPA: histidine kinase dimerization/phospho-acceptor domain-containing protein, partial [Alicycliphilus sp.]|nr:histidine kinase dimerization/phospho-acceptor domain-containing protein [Alicycliphilus sp.]
MPGETPAPGTPAALQAELAAARQQLTDLAAAQEAFLRAVSHDLRAPLRHVTSFGALVRELLQEQPPQLDEALQFLATMEASARRMGLMIDGLQAISRAARTPLRLQAVNLPAAV